MRQLRTIYKKNKEKIWIWCSMISMVHQIKFPKWIQQRTFIKVMDRDKIIKLKEIGFQQGKDAIEVHRIIWEEEYNLIKV